MNPYIDAGRWWADSLDRAGYVGIGIGIGVVIGFLVCGLLTRKD